MRRPENWKGEPSTCVDCKKRIADRPVKCDRKLIFRYKPPESGYYDMVIPDILHLCGRCKATRTIRGVPLTIPPEINYT